MKIYLKHREDIKIVLLLGILVVAIFHAIEVMDKGEKIASMANVLENAQIIFTYE